MPLLDAREPPAIRFVDHGAVERIRRREAANEILTALRPGDPLERLGRLVRADGLLEGSPLVSAARLALAEDLGERYVPRAAVVAELRSRLRSGAGELLSEFNRSGLEAMSEDPTIGRRLLAAADLATSHEPDLDTPWAVTASAGFEALRKAMQVAGEPLNDARKNWLTPQVIRRSSIAFNRVAMRFADELGALSRRVASTDPLRRWWEAARQISEIRRDGSNSNYAQVWKRAELAANELRRRVFHRERPDIDDLMEFVRGIGFDVAAGELPSPKALGTWSSGVAGQPTLVIGSDWAFHGPGRLRFAIGHLLGHVVAGDPEGACGYSEDPRSRSEAFANAFSVYFLAPRDRMNQILEIPRAGIDDDSLRAAARDVALAFGVTPRTACAHLLNHLHLDDVRGRLAALVASGKHRDWEEASSQAVELAWSGTFRLPFPEPNGLGGPRLGDRPWSHRWLELVEEAAARDLLSAEQLSNLVEGAGQP
ncbi:ImmA/IrrE family metallo-endopeptidase [Myxococcota bacterium]|nr:ImmA/IrrE family metallo-endopeptidase [Myxococcota bacterium]